MTPLRQQMIDDMRIRNLSPLTQTSYVGLVSLFARHFGRSPEVLEPEDIRAYLVYLTTERKLGTSSIRISVAALRFLYTVTLQKAWTINAVLPVPKKPQILPAVLSPGEVRHFLACVTDVRHRAILTSRYAAGLRISEAVGLAVSDIDSRRMVLRVVHGKGQKDRDRHALAQAPRPPARLVASQEAHGLPLPQPGHGRADYHPRREPGVSPRASAVRFVKTGHPPFAAPRLCRPPARIRHRHPHDPTAHGASQPRDDGSLPAPRHQHGLRHTESVRQTSPTRAP